MPTFSLNGSELVCDMPALVGVIQRSGGMRRIRRLDIDRTSAVLDIGVLLELLPSLDSISIKTGHLADNAIRRLSSGKLVPRLCNISLYMSDQTDLHHADQILSMVESRYQNAAQSPDSEDTPRPFKSISIPCNATANKLLHRKRIKSLSEKCDVGIHLDIGEDEGSEDVEDIYLTNADSEDEYWVATYWQYTFSPNCIFPLNLVTSGRRWSADTNLALRRDSSCELIANGFPRFAGFVNLPHETDLAAQGNVTRPHHYIRLTHVYK